MYLAMFYLLNMTHTRLYMCYIVTEEYHTYTMLANVAQVGSLYFPPAQGFRTLTCGELYTSHLSKVKYFNLQQNLDLCGSIYFHTGQGYKTLDRWEV